MTAVPAAPVRLAAARAALVRAEQRTGLASVGERAVAALPHMQEEDPWQGLSQETSGVVALSGSTSLLLAAAARCQGEQGWCAVVGGADLGWCAASSVGIDLRRVLIVPATQLDSQQLLSVLAALIDGVDVILLTGQAASRLSFRHQRTAAARARERHALILTDHPWEGVRTLRAEPRTTEPPAPALALPGAAAPHRAAEMPQGYLTSLEWTLHERQGAPGSRARFDAAGMHLEAGAPPSARSPHLHVLRGAS